MQLAWNTQKNKMNDVKGKEKEQDRNGRIKNEDIDLSRTNLNFDLVHDSRNLYQRVKDRVNYYKEQGSRVQKNSVVMYSNIITIPEDEYQNMGEDRAKTYFETCKDYFSERFGEDNVVSAKVHMDETTPHMHLHFVPVNDQNRLSARTAMDRTAINQIHDGLTEHLQKQGFDVERGKTKKDKDYIKDIHQYKSVEQEIKQANKDLKELYKEQDKVKDDILLYKAFKDDMSTKIDDLKKEYQKETNTLKTSLSDLKDEYELQKEKLSDIQTKSDKLEIDYDRDKEVKHKMLNYALKHAEKIYDGEVCAQVEKVEMVKLGIRKDPKADEEAINRYKNTRKKQSKLNFLKKDNDLEI